VAISRKPFVNFGVGFPLLAPLDAGATAAIPCPWAIESFFNKIFN
jgi:hypothetical protein